MKNMIYLSLASGIPHAHSSRHSSSVFTRKLSQNHLKRKEKKARFKSRVLQKNLQEIARLELEVATNTAASRLQLIKTRLRIIELKVANVILADHAHFDHEEQNAHQEHPIAVAFKNEMAHLKRELCNGDGKKVF